ncbi:MAG: GNAT family N-acetyltransferase [Pseudomonadota bacterium]
MDAMKLYSNRLILRSFQHTDLDAFADLHADPQVMHFLGGPWTRQQAEAELRTIMHIEATTGLPRLALEQRKQPGLIGYCGLKPAGDYVDLSYLLANAFWGLGYAAEAAQHMREFGLVALELTNMEAGGAADNIASIKILERLNFNHRENLTFNDRPAIRFYD